MKTLTFPLGVHLVALEDHTSPEDFLSAFQYENRHLEYINPSISIMRELDVSKDCCPVVLLPHHREDCGQLLDRLNRIALEHSATIFVFFSNPPEFLYEERLSFTSIVTYNKSTNGGIVKKGAGDMHEGPYTLDPLSNALEEVLKEPPSDDSAYEEAPSPKPTETVTKIKDLVKTRGFHQARVSVCNADALIRGDKTNYICIASRNIQKGDYLVLSVDGIVEGKFFHDINDIVWEVTFVSYIPNSTNDNAYGQVALSLRRIPNARFEKGDIAGPYHEDCIVTTTPTTP